MYWKSNQFTACKLKISEVKQAKNPTFLQIFDAFTLE